jgi:hypothetical protein
MACFSQGLEPSTAAPLVACSRSCSPRLSSPRAQGSAEHPNAYNMGCSVFIVAVVCRSFGSACGAVLWRSRLFRSERIRGSLGHLRITFRLCLGRGQNLDRLERLSGEVSVLAGRVLDVAPSAAAERRHENRPRAVSLSDTAAGRRIVRSSVW